MTVVVVVVVAVVLWGAFGRRVPFGVASSSPREALDSPQRRCTGVGGKPIASTIGTVRLAMPLADGSEHTVDEALAQVNIPPFR